MGFKFSKDYFQNDYTYICKKIFRKDYIHIVSDIKPFHPFIQNILDYNYLNNIDTNNLYLKLKPIEYKWGETIYYTPQPFYCFHHVCLNLSNNKIIYCILDSEEIIEWFKFKNIPLPHYFINYISSCEIERTKSPNYYELDNKPKWGWKKSNKLSIRW
jgi:hypothetical protein